MFAITYKSGHMSFGILADTVEDAIRAAKWLRPSDPILTAERYCDA